MGFGGELFEEELSEGPRFCDDGPRIYYLCTEPHRYVVEKYFSTWGRTIAPCVRIITYGELLAQDRLLSGVYIFADVERLGRVQRALAADICDQLNERPQSFLTLNYPSRIPTRFELLRCLAETGKNKFNAYRLWELPRPLERRVFIRHTFEHSGSFTEPTSDETELDEAIAVLLMQGFRPQDLIAVEFMDTQGEDGLYRKHACFRVGDEIFPRQMHFGEHWMLRYPDLREPEQLDEEWRFMKNNPHREALLSIFDSAGVKYGRIDYGLHEGEVQTWEINTHPIIMQPPEHSPEDHMPHQRFFARTIRDVFARLASTRLEGEGLRPQLSGALLRRALQDVAIS